MVRVPIVALMWAMLFPHALAPALADPALLARTGTIRVMAFGDSITAGVGAHGSNARDGGYRGALGALLEREGYRVVFVGSRSDYAAGIVNRAHEGWPGYVVRSFPADPGPGQLVGAIAHNALQRNAPDVVLVMAGTNDLLRLQRHAAGYTLPNIVASMKLLIDQLISERPNAEVVVAPVVASPAIDASVLRDFASGLQGLVDAYAARGARVVFAPGMASAVPRDAEHFPDGIHPTGNDGYVSIANVWFSAIEQLMQPTQSNVAADGATR
jgi:lysophospholipase L1-like esterase